MGTLLMLLLKQRVVVGYYGDLVVVSFSTTSERHLEDHDLEDPAERMFLRNIHRTDTRKNCS
jgi:hypothetical protein